jgi:hypothetical protein
MAMVKQQHVNVRANLQEVIVMAMQEHVLVMP